MSPRRAKAVTGRVGDDPATALREHLIDTAEQLLAQRQVSTITTREIARTAGVSDGVLYNYFTDKYDLLLAALLRRYQSLADRFAAALPEPGTGTVAENLRTFAAASLAFQADLLPIGVGLISEPALLHRFMEVIHTDLHGPQQNQSRLSSYLLDEQRLGRLPEDADPVAAATLLTGACLNFAIAGLVMPDGVRPDPATALPAAVQTLLRGLQPDTAYPTPAASPAPSR
jgi:AcrR family transcriptional regulator